MLAATVAVTTTPVTTAYPLENVLPSLGQKLGELVTAPFNNPDMLWITLPLIIALFMMEFYFGRYRREELGWNTAVGNSLVLIFVSIDLLKHIYDSNPISETFLTNPGKTIVAVAVGLSGLLIFYYDFFHLLPKWVAFKISSALAVNITAYLAVVFIYANIEIDAYTILAAIILFMATAAFFSIVHMLEPKIEPKRQSKLERILNKLLKTPRHGRNKGRKKANPHIANSRP